MNKNIKLIRVIPHLFVVLFFFSQINLLHHEISHAADNSQSPCLTCMSTPSQIHDNTITLAFESINQDFVFYVTFDDVITLQPVIHYLGRAPPVG